jgi:4-hydroxybenzoate polyprenyltransferase
MTGTILVYSLQRWYKLVFIEIEPITDKGKWLVQNPRIFWTITLLAALVFSSESLKMMDTLLQHWLGFLFAGAIAVWYVVRVKNQNLRELPYTKIFWVVAVYVYFTSFLPNDNSQTALGDIARLAIINGLYIFGITLLFDLRDAKIDDKRTRTIPQLIGENKTMWLSFLAVVAALTILFGTIHISNSTKIILVGLHFLIYSIALKTPKKDPMVSLLFEGLIGATGLAVYFNI